MNPDEKMVKMAAQMYDMRDKAKRLLGDKYKWHMAELGKILTMISDRDKKGVLVTAIDHCKKRNLVGMELWLTIAAAVELVEPSK